jgi:TNF receptor-associated protein 1
MHVVTMPGMTKEELIDNLGTIARSGSKAFIAKMKASSGDGAAQAKDSIIGQFGVGFYAGFMVGKEISVVSRSFEEGAVPYMWKSEGTGEYEIVETQADG